MRRSRSVLLAAGLFAASVGLTVAWGQIAVIAQPAIKKDEPKTGNPATNSIEYIAFPQDRDAQNLLDAVQGYIKEARADNEKWDRICEAAQRVLDIKSDSFFEIEDVVDGEKKKTRISVRVHANNLIGSFKPAGRQFYQLTYGPAAQQLLDEAIRDNYDRVRLGLCSQRYFHTKAGAEATLLLAGLYLDRGQYLEAAYTYDRYLNRPDVGEIAPRTLFKAALAHKRAGDGLNAGKAAKLWEQFAKVMPRDGLVFGNRTFDAETLKAEFDRGATAGSFLSGDLYVAMRMGNVSHTSRGQGGTVFLDPNFILPMVYTRTDLQARKLGYDWVRQNLDLAIKRIGQQKNVPIIPAFFPCSAPGVLLVRNYSGLVCLAAKDGPIGGRVYKAGDVVWYTPTDRSLVGEATVAESSLNAFWAYYQNIAPGLLFENVLAGTLSHDGKSAYFVDDLAIPPPPGNANDPNMGRYVPQGDGSANKISQSQLWSVNIESGKSEWILGMPGGGNTTDEKDDAESNPLLLTQGAFFLGPPVTVNGKLYILFEKNGKLRLACLDTNRKTKVSASPDDPPMEVPTVVWSQRLGEPKDRLPGDSVRRYQGSFLAYSDGVLVVSTNTGAVVGLDVMARSLLWAHSYRTRDPGADANGDEAARMGRLGRRVPTAVNATGPVPTARWRAAAPIIAHGKVIVTAYDSKSINCIDLRTGNLIWFDDMDPVDDLYVGGLIDDRILVIGSKAARAYELNPPLSDPKSKKVKPVWSKVPLGLPCGHGVVATNGLYYLPVAKSAESELPQIWALDPKKGEVVSKTTFRRKLTSAPGDPIPLGNLIFHEGQVFTQTPQEILAFPLMDLKRSAMDELLKANPNDPAGLAARGEILLDDGKIDAAIADLRKARASNPPDAITRRVRDKLYQAYTEVLRKDFTAGESFLEEYKTLLELPIDTQDPAEKQRLIDEQLNRKARYLTILARGREKQGRLVEAYTHYREFAGLGDNKSPIAIEGEPYAMVRPDVWARGRIDGMIRGAKDSAAKASLETLVKSEWDIVRNGNDTARLKEFVTVFGPYFAEGRQAQLVLANRLLASGDDDQVRDGEAMLTRIVADAPDGDPSAAKAAESLAASLLKNNLYEDAVALYGQIGKRFGTTVIRDGKTGADLLSDLLADRRLLPYLEPTRARPTGPAKVERKDAMENRAMTMSFVVEPEGELLPFYDRYRLTIEMNANGSPNWSLKLEDRTSKAIRCKFDGLFPPVNFNINSGSASWSDLKFAQADGHVLLLHLGLIVYCVDLAEKKILWQYNLLAGSSTPPPMRSQTTGTDGELTIQFEDGWTIRLGRSAVIRNGIAGLLTRDGLVAIDVRTGQKLWQQGGINPRSILFGDGQHFLVADPGESGKETGKVLRAVDGTTVEGIPEFAKLVMKSTRVKIIGRSLLMFDSEGDAKVLRLYDPISGKNLWTKSYAKDAKLTRCYDNRFVGIVEPKGSFELIRATSGESAFKTRLEASVVEGSGAGNFDSPTVLIDEERVYLVTNNPRNAARNVYFYGQQGIRMISLNGPMICFDRASGAFKWFTKNQFENQQLVLDRFAEMPVLLAAVNGYDQNTGVQSCEVIALDKSTGKVKFRDNRLSPNGPFQSLELDAKTGNFELKRYDTKIVISPVAPTRD